MNVRDRLYQSALERGLRRSTLVSYETLLGRLGLLDQEADSVTIEQVLEALWTIESPNTRRAAAIAVRSTLGLAVRIPKGTPRRYDLPSEADLRLALMLSPHEIRGLLMLYAGLRVGEACAVTHRDVHGDRLRVDKQVQQIQQTGKPTTVSIGPVKTAERSVVIPVWLAERLAGLEGTAKPDAVRESLRRAGKKVGLALNPHMLRHAYATMLLERGVPVMVVSKQLGHADPSITLRTYAQHDIGKAIHDVLG